jgi:hypothetical protein
LTKPISTRPREITSSIEYSSATRTASKRLPIGMPRHNSRAFFVSRARIAIGIVQTESMQVAVAWCSFTMMLSPSSSHRAHSSSPRWYRSAAILGSQSRFGTTLRSWAPSSSHAEG